jgi:uncharacterized protein involved in outer membrane biogenesis
MKNIQRTLVIIFVGVFVVFVAISGVLFFFVRNFDANKFKPQILAAMTQALGRKVAVADIALNFSLFQGIFV